jgi:hydrogenase 3 maturation protease
VNGVDKISKIFNNEQLLEFINGYDKFLILGIGNELRGDDGLGSLLIDNLNANITEDYLKKKDIILINGGSAPENFTGLIIKENPSHILIIDAILTDKEPGTILSIDSNEIAKYNFSTHSMSLNFLIKYLYNEIDFEVFILGVVVESMNLGDDLSKSAKDSLKKIQNNLIADF